MARIEGIQGQYATGATREQTARALVAVGKSPDALIAADLAPLEDFHLLGRVATAALAELAGISAEDRVLDAGAGIGGPARFLADTYRCQVTIVDLTAEFCDAARWLNSAVGLAERIAVYHGDVLDLPFPDASFDVVVSEHVQMNIADKPRLYREARRVLATGGRLALWDVVAGDGRPLAFPLPWANSPAGSHLVTADTLRDTVCAAGFQVRDWTDRTEFSIEPMRAFLAAPRGELGLQVFVPDFDTKARNLLSSLEQGQSQLIQAVLTVARN